MVTVARAHRPVALMCWCAAFVCAWPEIAAGQARDAAARIYEKASPSVFVILVHDAKGTPLSLGTGFLIGRNTLATNLHVVEGGSVSVHIGLVDIPATLEKRDAKNDLAFIRVNADISATPLLLSKKASVPGESVIVIGNPEGLENTVSTGVVAGVRVMEGRTLLQISAPISHGSSGGPVLNSEGEVVGVAVGMLSDGQNLNFAVPADRIQALLIRGNSPPSQEDVSALLSQAVSLSKAQQGRQYSNDADSDWQKTDRGIDSLLQSALEQAGQNPDLLLRVAKQAEYQDEDIAISAAERAIAIRPSADAELLLGQSLPVKATFETGAQQTSDWAVAEDAFRSAIRSSKPQTPAMYSGLALALERLGSYSESKAAYRQAHWLLQWLEQTKGEVSPDAAQRALRGLIRTTADLKQSAESEACFQELVNRGMAEAADWEQEAHRLDMNGEYSEAGKAWVKAAGLGGAWDDWCWAANSLQGVDDDDALSSARKCIEAGTGKDNSAVPLSIAHRVIAQVLNGRGVYSEALVNAREATDLDSTSEWNFQVLAQALYGLRRFQEAINASNQAIRLSDGNYSEMHLLLGKSYFEVKNWGICEAEL